MNKKMIIILIGGVVLVLVVILGVVLINKNNTEEYNMSGKKQLANSIQNNENIEVITTLANQNAISPNENTKENEEYILRENNGYIAIYKINEEKKEILLETTDIAIAYLPDVDKIELSRGIKIYGKEALNIRLEDYE